MAHLIESGHGHSTVSQTDSGKIPNPRDPLGIHNNFPRPSTLYEKEALERIWPMTDDIARDSFAESDHRELHGTSHYSFTLALHQSVGWPTIRSKNRLTKGVLTSPVGHFWVPKYFCNGLIMNPYE